MNCRYFTMEGFGFILAASESQLLEARTAVERSVISRVYLTAMYPNGDGDVSRDQYVKLTLNLVL